VREKDNDGDVEENEDEKKSPKCPRGWDDARYHDDSIESVVIQ
jgi:hypothetical protein